MHRQQGRGKDDEEGPAADQALGGRGRRAVGRGARGVVQLTGRVPVATLPEPARGTRPQKRTTPAGMRARAALLWAGSVVEPALLMWNHDGLDAAAGGG